MSSYCLFQEPWWLDAVAPGAWRSLEVNRGEKIAARMPIVLQRRYGFTIISQPPLTPTLGPWIDLTSTKVTTRIAEEKVLFNSLIDQLPRWDYFLATFNHRITNWLPFYWRGFKQTTRYTYVLDDLSNMETIWKGLRAQVRTHIRNAERQLSVRTDLSIDQLLDIVELTYLRQSKQLPFTRELVRRIDEACLKRGARHLFFAMDSDERIHAALYLVRDAEYAYNLLAGADPRLRGSGAQLLLLWEAIKLAATLKLKFDFEGSIIESIERVFRGFGAVQVPYMQVYGARPLVQMLLLMRELSIRQGGAQRKVAAADRDDDSLRGDRFSLVQPLLKSS
jgi:hypothetical protein